MKKTLTLLLLFTATITAIAQNINDNKESGIENMDNRDELKVPVDRIFLYSRPYEGLRIEVDSTALDEYIATPTQYLHNYQRITRQDVITPDDVNKIFSLKGIDKQNYIAAEFEWEKNFKRYFVYAAEENEQEQARVKAMAQVLIDKRMEVQRKIEAERQYILDNPWPHKTVFRGNHYTKTTYPDSEQGVTQNDYGEWLDTTTYYVHSEGAYPRDFVWKEGYSLHEAGTRIHSIKGIDPKYYILVWGTIYANDKYRNDALDKKVCKISQEAYRKWQAAYKVETLLWQLERNGFSKNAARLLTDDQYPPSDTVAPNENLRIVSTWIDSHDYPLREQDQIPEGFFEIDFGKYDPEKGFSPFSERKKRKIYFYKKEENDYILYIDNINLSNADNIDFRLKALYTDEEYNRLYSRLIDDHIPERAVPVPEGESECTPDISHFVSPMDAAKGYR